MRSKITFIAAVLLCICSMFTESKAQNTETYRSDIEFWTRLELHKEWTKRWETDLNYNFRFQDTFSALKTHFIQIENSYEILNFLEAAVKFRYHLDSPKMDQRYRIAPELRFKYNYNAFRLRFRSLYQFDWQNMEWHREFRNAIKLRYKQKWIFYPGISFELFRSFGEISGFIKQRTLLELNSDFSKKHALNIDLGFQNEFQVNKPQFDWIISLSYRFDL